MPDVSLDTIGNLSPELQRAFQLSAKAERRPLERIENRKQAVEQKVELLNDIIGRVNNVKQLLPNLNSPVAIREFSVESDYPGVVSGTADKLQAEPGKHSIEVSRLAKSASALSNRFEDKDRTRVGTGYFTYETLDGDDIEIFIDNENSTLEGIARVINSSNIGMKATVVNDQVDPDAPYRLLLSATHSGAQEDVEYPEFYFIDGEEDFFIEEQKPAMNALFTYEGFEIESPSNEVDDLIKGVTLNLKGISELGRPASISVEHDLPKTSVKIKDLVENVNKVFSFVQEQNKLDENSDTLRTLGGDYGIRMTENRLRNALRENFIFKEGKNIQSLSDLGIQFNRNGLLDFDDKKLQHALQTHFDEVVDLLAGDGRSYGVITKLHSAVKSITRSGNGLLSSQKSNYANNIRRMDQEIKTQEDKVAKRLESLKGKLAKTQAALSALETQSNYFQGSQASSTSSLIG